MKNPAIMKTIELSTIIEKVYPNGMQLNIAKLPITLAIIHQ